MFKINKKEKTAVYHAPEYKQFLILRIISFIFLGLLFFGAGAGSLFIYQNIFSTIEEAENMIATTDNQNIEMLDFQKYERVEEAWQEKMQDRALEIKRDIFNPIMVTTSTPKKK